ncbi:hypothetical protein HMPREF1585_00354, partial [Gardnerella vaginalis JCP8481B]
SFTHFLAYNPLFQTIKNELSLPFEINAKAEICAETYDRK